MSDIISAEPHARVIITATKEARTIKQGKNPNPKIKRYCNREVKIKKEDKNINNTAQQIRD